MSRPVLTNLDLTKNQILNVVGQNLASAPSSPVEGQFYFDTTLHQFGVYQNGTWTYLGAAAANAITRAVAAGGANELLVAAGADRTVQAFTSNGLLKIASGVVANAVAGTDYVTGASTNTLTNKTFDANGTGNSVSNIETADFASNVVDTDTSLAANSDTRLATQKAVKAYVDALLNAMDAMVLKGGIDASGNPNYPAANAGYLYKITVAGKIGGASGINVTAGDTIYCITDSSAGGTQASVGADWVIVQANVDAATTSVAGLVALADSTVAEAKSDAAKALTAASVVNFPIKKTFTIGDNSTTSLTCTHNLGTKDVMVSVRDASTDAEVLADVVRTSTSVVTITFAVAPATNGIKVVIIG